MNTNAYVPTYKESGRGDRTIVFLHGLGGNRHAFDYQLEKLSEQFHCIAWDMPGYGGSEPIASISFDVLAACLDNLFHAIDKKPYAIIGHSMGGMVAQTWLHGGGNCERLVLAQTSAAFGKPGSQWNQDFLAARLAPLDARQTPADFARTLVESMFHDPSKTTAIEAGVNTMAPLPADVYRAIIACLVTFNQADNLTNINLPTLCLAAQYDTTAPAKNMQRMASELPHGEYTCLPDAGHLAYIETPDTFTQRLDEFLDI